MGIGDAFSKLGDMNKLRQQAMQMQKSLAAQQVVVEENGVKVVISGDQKVLELTIQGMSNQVLNDVLNKAIQCRHVPNKKESITCQLLLSFISFPHDHKKRSVT